MGTYAIRVSNLDNDSFSIVEIVASTVDEALLIPKTNKRIVTRPLTSEHKHGLLLDDYILQYLKNKYCIKSGLLFSANRKKHISKNGSVYIPGYGYINKRRLAYFLLYDIMPYGYDNVVTYVDDNNGFTKQNLKLVSLSCMKLNMYKHKNK